MPNIAPTHYRYEIEPRAPHLGGGWRLRLFERDIEVAGGVFPPDPDIEDHQTALDDAHCEAMCEGESWLADCSSPSTDAATAAPTFETRTRIGPDNV